MFGMPTSRPRLMLANGLTLFLASCGLIPPENPRPVPNADGVSELAKTVCDIWGKSQPTWVDGDTPGTIDAIDYGYRVQEATCVPIQGAE